MRKVSHRMAGSPGLNESKAAKKAMLVESGRAAKFMEALPGMIAENNRIAGAIGAVLTSYLASRDPTKMKIGEVLSLADVFLALTRNAIAAHETLHKTAGMPAPGMGRDDDGNLLNGEIHLPERRPNDLDRIVADSKGE
jgi:hypothetical protein